MHLNFLFGLLLISCFACNSNSEDFANDTRESGIAFNKTDWIKKEGSTYPYRDQMLDDVLYSETIRSLNKDKVLELLGKPDRTSDGYLYYIITQKRLGFLTLHTKTMVIKFMDEDLVEWIKIHE